MTGRNDGKLADLGPLGKFTTSIGGLAIFNEIHAPGWSIAIYLASSAFVEVEAIAWWYQHRHETKAAR